MSTPDEQRHDDEELELQAESVKDLDVEEAAADQVLGGQTRTTKPAQPE